MSCTAAPPAADCRPAGRRSERRRHLALAVIATGMFMVVLDTTIVNLALPAIRADFAAPVSALTWVVDAYTLSFAALIMLGGAASDRLGARTVYLAGLALFVGASGACAMATGTGALITARFAQGMGAALFLPASLALVRQTFEDPQGRARAVAAWALIASVGAALGPLAGGMLVDALGWRSVFLINLPFGLAALLSSIVFIEGRRGDGSRAFDAAGQLASAVALAATCFVAVELPERGLGAVEVWAPALLALAAAAAFVMAERRAAQPMVPLAWFGDRTFAAMTGVAVLLNLSFYGMLFALSIHLQDARHLSARAAGQALLPMAISLTAGNALSHRLSGRIPPQRLMVGALSAAALAVLLAASALTAGAALPWVHAGLMLMGLGNAASVAPMLSSALEQVPAGQAGIASGLLNAMRQTGSLLGVALAGAAVALARDADSALWTVAAVSSAAYASAALLTWHGARPRDPARPG
ncbi:MFS transporter [Xenophilus aerolatus]|nr:MFS transporter [Xenophilus aerolatus]